MNQLQKKALRKKLGNICNICGYGDCSEILTLHHIYPKRNGKQPPLPRHKRYILVCPNCHMKIEKNILKGYVIG